MKHSIAMKEKVFRGHGEFIYIKSNQSTVIDWIENDNLGVLMVAGGGVRLRAFLEDESDRRGCEPIILDEVNEFGLIFIRTLGTKLCEGIRLEIDSKENVYLHAIPWSTFQNLAFENDPSLTSIINSALNDQAQIINRYKIRKTCSINERMAAAIVTCIFDDNRLLAKYNSVASENDLMSWVEVPLKRSMITRDWDMVSGVVTKAYDQLVELRIISEKRTNGNYTVNLYMLKEYIKSHSLDYLG